MNETGMQARGLIGDPSPDEGHLSLSSVITSVAYVSTTIELNDISSRHTQLKAQKPSLGS